MCAVLAVAIAGLAERPAEALSPGRALTQYQLDVWTPARGAPFGTVTSIAQTPDGYLWLGTHAKGLFRFDGIRFTPVAELDRLLGRIYAINKLAATADGTVWVGTPVGLIRGAKGIWEKVDAEPVVDLTVNDRGELLVVRLGSGLQRWQRDRLQPVSREPDWVFVAGREAGGLWGSSADKPGLLRLQAQGLTRVTPAEGLLDHYVGAIHVGPGGNVWAAGRRGLNHLRDGRVVDRVTAAQRPAERRAAGRLRRWAGFRVGGHPEQWDRPGARPRSRDLRQAAGASGRGGVRVPRGPGGKPLDRPRAAASPASERHISRPTVSRKGWPTTASPRLRREGTARIYLWSDGGGLTQIHDGRVERTYSRRDGLRSDFGGPAVREPRRRGVDRPRSRDEPRAQTAGSRSTAKACSRTNTCPRSPRTARASSRSSSAAGSCAS